MNSGVTVITRLTVTPVVWLSHLRKTSSTYDVRCLTGLSEKIAVNILITAKMLRGSESGL